MLVKDVVKGISGHEEKEVVGGNVSEGKKSLGRYTRR
jgi:hypothetical protein